MNDQQLEIQSWEALDYVPIGVVILREDFTVVHWNMCLEEWTGIRASEMLGSNVTARFPGFTRPDVAERVKTVFSGGPPVVLSSQLHSCVIPMRGKEEAFQEVMVTGVQATEGDGYFAIFAIQDVTDLATRVRGYWEINKRLEREANERLAEIAERKKAERALSESEERLRAILDTAADAIITVDRAGIVVGVNAAAEPIFGYSRNELVGKNVKILMPQPTRDEYDGHIDRYLKTGEARIIGIGREVIARRSDGSTFAAELAVSEVKHLGLFTGILRDVTDRKEAREAVATRTSTEREHHPHRPKHRLGAGHRRSYCSNQSVHGGIDWLATRRGSRPRLVRGLFARAGSGAGSRVVLSSDRQGKDPRH